MNQKLFMFWEYDRFPYVLGSEMLEIDKEGYGRPDGYQSMRFKPILILPLAEGKKVHEKLQALKNERRGALDALDATFMEKREAIIKL